MSFENYIALTYLTIGKFSCSCTSTLTELYCSKAGAISRNVACYYYVKFFSVHHLVFLPSFRSFSHALICYVNKLS